MKKIYKHFMTITKHRLKVFKLCIKAGIPWRGFVHDLSKYSPTEFFEGVKYYQGTYSPISNCKKDIGYSKAWLHHFGRNKHHHEYWYDYNAPTPTPIMPYKYAIESICDSLAAGITYQGKNWTKEYQLSYWDKNKEKYKLNPLMHNFFEHIFIEVSKNGLNPIINKKYLKQKYKELVIDGTEITTNDRKS